jgi:hypothetical protein
MAPQISVFPWQQENTAVMEEMFSMWSQSLRLSIQFITSLMLFSTLLILGVSSSLFFILSVIFHSSGLSYSFFTILADSSWDFHHLHDCRVWGHIAHSKWPTRHSLLNEVIYEEKKNLKWNLKQLFTKKINGIILGDMTRPALYPNPCNSEACYNGALLYLHILFEATVTEI